ncbi:MAG: recombinase family protein [Chloroflexi bacterium]|nr:recombinase family protein [Chloroflexota bacterium]
MKRAALYERVSTDAQVEKYGLSAQDRALKKRTTEKGYLLVPNMDKDAFVDDGYSGGDTNRPALLRLRQSVAEGRVDVVLCHDPDRLSRSLSDLLLLSDELKRAGIQLEFITQETDASPEGRMFFAMRGAVAEYERAKIRERTTRGRLEKAKQGKVVSGAAAPFGYTFDPKTSTLQINEDHAKVVRMAFYLYLQEHLSITKLADRLNRLGTPPPSGKRWHTSTLGRMLCNETYAGTLWQNKWQTQKIDCGQQRQPRIQESIRPKDEHISAQVPPMVPREMFDAVQNRLRENSHLAMRNTKHEYLLAGLLRHTCGSGMGAKTTKGTAYYYCYKSQKFKAPIDEKGQAVPCRCSWVNGHALDGAVWDTVTNLLRRPDLLVAEVERLTKPDSATREVLNEELAMLRKRLEELPKEERRLVEGYRKGFFADFMMREEMERIRKERGDVDERCRQLELQLSRLDRAASYKSKVEDLAETLNCGLDQMDFDKRRELIRLLVDQVVYDQGHVTIKTIIPLGDGESQLQPISPPARGGRTGGFPSFRGRTGMTDQKHK